MPEQTPLFEDFFDGQKKQDKPEVKPVEEPKNFLTFNMMYAHLISIRRQLDRMERRISEVDNRVRQYSARVALVIDGDTPNDDTH